MLLHNEFCCCFVLFSWKRVDSLDVSEAIFLLICLQSDINLHLKHLHIQILEIWDQSCLWNLKTSKTIFLLISLKSDINLHLKHLHNQIKGILRKALYRILRLQKHLKVEWSLITTFHYDSFFFKHVTHKVHTYIRKQIVIVYLCR